MGLMSKVLLSFVSIVAGLQSSKYTKGTSIFNLNATEIPGNADRIRESNGDTSMGLTANPKKPDVDGLSHQTPETNNLNEWCLEKENQGSRDCFQDLNYRKETPRNFGSANMPTAMVLLGACVVVVFWVLLDIGFALSRKDTREVGQALGGLNMIWVMILGISILTCCTSVWRAQGLEIGKFRFEIRRKTTKFRYEEHFIPFAVVGCISALAMVLTSVYHKYVHDGKASPEGVVSGLSSQVDHNARPQRNHSMDHMKYLLTQMIVTVHMCINDATNRQGIWISYLSVVAVTVVPGFALMSGYHSPQNPSQLNSRRLARVLMMAVSYYICQSLYILFTEHAFIPMTRATFADTANADVWINSFNPFSKDQILIDKLFGTAFWHLFYLQSLVVWSLLSPFWMQLRYPVTLSIVVSCVASYLKPPIFEEFFDPAKTLEYLPWFVIGLSMRRYGYDKSLKRLAKDKYATKAAIVTVCCYLAWNLALPFSAVDELGIFVWIGRSTRIKARDIQCWYWIGRFGVIFCSLSFLFAIYSMMPSRRTYFSHAAKGALIPYITHFVFVLLLVATGWFYNGPKVKPENTPQLPAWKSLVTFLFSIVTCHFLFGKRARQKDHRKRAKERGKERGKERERV
ncbi:hypothetical protein AAMO2058_000884500 [Amorphochlora amoebiformis]